MLVSTENLGKADLSAVTCQSFKDAMTCLNEQAVKEMFPEGDWITAVWVVGAYYEVRRQINEDLREKARTMSKEWIQQADCEAGVWIS